MKLAVVGKGGSGKTVLSALLARALAAGGRQVLAVDLDTNPGLFVSLGLEPADVPLPGDAVEAREGVPYGHGLSAAVTPAEAVARWGVSTGDGVMALGFGNIARADHPLGRYLTAVREIAAGFDEPGWAVVADLEAGPATPFEGFARFADLALVAVEPTPASCLAARRILSVLGADETPAGLVVTEASGPAGADGVDPGVVLGDVRLLARVPFDPAVRRAERDGSLRDLDPASPAAAAVAALRARIEQELATEVAP